MVLADPSESAARIVRRLAEDIGVMTSGEFSLLHGSVEMCIVSVASMALKLRQDVQTACADRARAAENMDGLWVSLCEYVDRDDA